MDLFLFGMGVLTIISSLIYLIITLIKKKFAFKLFSGLIIAGFLLCSIGLFMPSENTEIESTIESLERTNPSKSDNKKQTPIKSTEMTDSKEKTENQNSSSEQKDTTTPVVVVPEEETNTDTKIDEVNALEEKVKTIAKDFKSASLKSIEVNEHMGTESPDDYIVLAYFELDPMSAKTTKTLIDLYNNELGAQLATETYVEEIAVFWEAPYHIEGANVAKANLIRNGYNMVFTTAWTDPVLE